MNTPWNMNKHTRDEAGIHRLWAESAGTHSPQQGAATCQLLRNTVLYLKTYIDSNKCLNS